MTEPRPRWRRRKTARPGEIIAAALEVFAEKGFAGAKLDDIAERAGVSKGALYLYFETKDDIFRAVVREAVAPNLDMVEAVLAQATLPFPDLLRMVFSRIVQLIGTSRLGAVAKLVIGESRNFPELAKTYYDLVVSHAIALLAGLVAKGQARGEVREGDPRLHAMSLFGPILMGLLWRETLEPAGGPPIDLHALARQHAETVLEGLLV